jgi:geranylgeranyl diphosphate synthase type II
VIAPLRIGVICGAGPGPLAPLKRDMLRLIELGYLAGVAFQICDDLLNLEAEEAVYGKETSGDLWEGKRTIMLLHFLRTAKPRARSRALRILRTPRKSKEEKDVAWMLQAMTKAGSLQHGRERARHYSRQALEVDDSLSFFRGDPNDRRFLREMLGYVIDRTK